MPIDHESENANPSGLSKDQLDDLEAKFSECQTLVNASCVGAAFVIFFVSYLLLTNANRMFANAAGRSKRIQIYRSAM